MERYTIYLALDSSGLKKFHCNQQRIGVKHEYGLCNFVGNQSKYFAVVCPPEFAEGICDDEKQNCDIPAGLFCWEEEKNIGLLQLPNSAFNCDTELTQDAWEFVADCMHKLCDELPMHGLFSTHLYLFLGQDSPTSLPMVLLSALKRLEVWHNFVMLVASEDRQDVSCLRDYINFHEANVNDAFSNDLKCFLWCGELNLVMEKRCGKIPLHHGYLFLADDGISLEHVQEVPFMKHVFQKPERDGVNFIFDNELQLVGFLRHEDLPLHLIIPIRFQITYKKTWKESHFDVFQFTSAYFQNSWLLGFLCYDVEDKKSVKYSTTDWNELLCKDFTHYLSSDMCKQNLKYHYPMILRHASNAEDKLDVYFFRDYRNIDSSAYLEILKQTKMMQGPIDLEEKDNTHINSSESSEDINFNGAAEIDSQQWYERMAWVMEENLSKVHRSIARLKSDDMYLNGVMKPPDSDTGQQQESKAKSNTFDDILNSFDEVCKPVGRTLELVPVIPDRLLKNMKSEDVVKMLPYEDAVQVIGHGLEYCVDSLSSLRLDSRLTKVQKRYVPEDTINMTKSAPKITTDKVSCEKGKEKKLSKPSSKRAKVSESNPHESGKRNDTHRKMSETESRSQRYKRRLRVIVESAVTKHGGIEKSSKDYKNCCDDLFNICLPLVKKLKSTKGLADEMRTFARTYAHQVAEKYKQ